MPFVHRYRPSEAGDKRTLLVLHGTGGDENSLIEVADLVAPTAGILSPRGNVLENGMPRFFRRFAEGVFDYEDIRRRAVDLADFIGEAATEYGFDPQHVIGVGYSNGANIAWSAMLLRPSCLAAAVLFRSMVTLTDVAAPDLSGKRVFIAAGKQDPIVPVSNTEQLAAQIRSYGADVDVYWYPGGHELSREEIDRARAFLDEES